MRSASALPRFSSGAKRRPLLALAGLAVAAAVIASTPTMAQAAPAGTGSFILTDTYTGIDTPPLRSIQSAPSSFYVDADAGRMYVSEQNDVAIIDVDNGERLGSVSLAENYGSLAFDSANNALVVFNGTNLIRIDIASMAITSSQRLPDFGQGGNSAFNRTTGAMFYSIHRDSSPFIGKTVGDSEISTGYLGNFATNVQYSRPAIDEARNLVYIVNPGGKEVDVVDGESLEVVRRISTPFDYNSLGFDPISKRLYASDDNAGGGTLVTIDTTDNTVSPPVTIDPAGAGTVSVDPSSGRVLVATGTDDAPKIAWLNPDTQAVMQTIPVPATVNAFSWDGAGAVYGNTTGQSIIRLEYGVAPTVTSPASAGTAIVGTG